MISNINKGSHQLKDRTLHLVKRKRMKEHLQFKEQFKSLPWKLINRNWLSQGLGVSVELVLMSRGRHYQIQSPLKRQKQVKGNHRFKRRQAVTMQAVHVLET
ncbi:hypothetical protein Cadr_000015908 [Camelus dromedarius]|uniref:Uncharacterized protein n=1 Tax=Camelus dromedarius TaxID=9838 RepID=A0A5N4EAA3_CAMDR|nr:hypothetical protein Cadr_000015908 [Camelus dromedarius]